MKYFKTLYQFEHGIVEIQPFHLYAKKRILLERKFVPLTELYEFRIFIINNKIKFYVLSYRLKGKKNIFLCYDNKYNFLFPKKENEVKPLNLTSVFKKTVLDKLKEYSIKLSEDFPNFIRVDLFVFQGKIYLSELTFCSFGGNPWFRNEKIVKDSMVNFSKIDDYY